MSRVVSAKTIMAQLAWERDQERGPGLFLPLQCVSEANARGHWAKGHKRAKEQRGTVSLMLRGWRPVLPCVVTLTRYGVKRLDDDNLARSLKAVRDGVADAFRTDDSAKGGIRFLYTQQTGRFYGCRIELTPASAGVETR